MAGSMHRHLTRIAVAAALVLGCGCLTSDDDDTTPTGWEIQKASASVTVHLTAEFDTPRQLSLATLGWEDGLNVSRDGLHLYATYIPADFLSYVLNGDSTDPANLPPYKRGPTYTMDFDGSLVGATYEWLHSDIIYASRASTAEEFSPWQLSGMARAVYSEGAVSAVFSGADAIEMLYFTSNENYADQNDFKVITNTTPDPSGVGTFASATINSSAIEDNPHIERVGANNLVLFWDSEDRAGGAGGHDLWYAASADDGATWSAPANVSSVNTSEKEHQPHLYQDGSDWLLYYSANHTDGKLAIYRRTLGTAGDWDSWGAAELVLSAGNTVGIGEPTLTTDGDLLFIAVIENEVDGSYYDRYDGDPWVAERK